MIEFIEFPAFTRRLGALAGKQADDVLLTIQSDLLLAPERGATVVGLGGIRKARAADPTRGKGKRGGFRYLYYYLEVDEQIFLMYVFGKDEQEDLNDEQRKQLRTMVQRLKEAR